MTTSQFWLQSLDRLSLVKLLRTRMLLVKLAVAIFLYYWLIFI